MSAKFDMSKVVSQVVSTLKTVASISDTGEMSERSREYALANLAGAVPTAMHYRLRWLEPRIDELMQELRDMADPMITDGTVKTPTVVPEVLEAQIGRKLDFMADLEAQADQARTTLEIGKEVYRKLVGEEWKPPTKPAPKGPAVAERLAAVLAAKSAA